MGNVRQAIVEIEGEKYAIVSGDNCLKQVRQHFEPKMVGLLKRKIEP